MDWHPVWGFVTDFGDTAITVPLAVLMGIVLFAVGAWRLALGWCIAIAGCAAAIGAAKLALVGCALPALGDSLSSPSGHTAMGTAVYGGFAAVVGTTVSPAMRSILLMGAAALATGIALSRAVLRVHSELEVAVGLAVGLTAFGIILAMAFRHRPERLPAARIAVAVVVVALLFHGERWPAERAIHGVAGWLNALRPWCG